MAHTANGSVPLSYPPGDQPGFMSAPDMVESDVEDEVDQLESDSDTADTDADALNGMAGGGQRIPGHSLLPSLRLENIIQAEGVTGNLALSKEGLFILSVATEEFIQRMTQAGQLRASAEGRNTVNYSDMAATTQQYQEFMFLHDTIPAPVPLSEALLMRQAKEKESFDEDYGASTSTRPSTSMVASAAPAPKTTLKIRSTANGQSSSSTGSRQERRSESRTASSIHDHDAEAAYGDWTDARGAHPSPGPSISVPNGRISRSARASPLANGHSVDPSRSGTVTPHRSYEPSERASPNHYPQSQASSFAAPEEPQPQGWPGQYTGPASGFLQGPGGPFGRVAQNPGRTIYSQQHRAE
ncbi:putative histone-like transcription factor (CBF/NF-Y) and archaeal histone [Lyophyllum shimeji]|uniref:Histone-like transcription factor (CBF/NF-Y) and archaeal histone n=1 Tax=Lyophyllum shimeji TaxID=47721 RepID=A0A9P3PLJ0_LYOSH|nr:putative histone-like transcription factor (CBF/NF-Y) and archaeal histone [Lyophyllum shimeji]